MTHPTYIHADAILDAARARGRQESAKTKREQRDPDTGKAFWLYCDYPRFVEWLEALEAKRAAAKEAAQAGETSVSGV